MNSGDNFRASVLVDALNIVVHDPNTDLPTPVIDFLNLIEEKKDRRAGPFHAVVADFPVHPSAQATHFESCITAEILFWGDAELWSMPLCTTYTSPRSEPRAFFTIKRAGRVSTTEIIPSIWDLVPPEWRPGVKAAMEENMNFYDEGPTSDVEYNGQG